MTQQDWAERWSYDVVAVLDLPVPTDLSHPPCMVRPRSWFERRYRRFAPQSKARGCCWYHGGDWHRASSTAIRLVRAAEAAGHIDEDIAEHALNQADDEGISGWQLEALGSLVDPGTAIMLGDEPDEQWYIEGRHRATAMLDAGVRHTLVARFELLDPATGQPRPADEA